MPQEKELLFKIILLCNIYLVGGFLQICFTAGCLRSVDSTMDVTNIHLPGTQPNLLKAFKKSGIRLTLSMFLSISSDLTVS